MLALDINLNFATKFIKKIGRVKNARPIHEIIKNQTIKLTKLSM